MKDWAKKDKDNEVILPKHLIQQIDSIKLDKVNGRDYISEYKIEISMEYSDSSKNKIDELVKLYNIKIVDEWQQDPFVVTSRIPNGMKIGVPDDRPFNYIWKDGRPTKVIDEAATNTLDKVEFKTDNNNSRLRIILFASCVVILILILTLSKIILRKRY
ncbi:hypothetical protein KIH39_21925 [Telmatocola sphagniphila]|uniref:Uncharacterized protein n=1 Tax=Telmatocola sphagniphila TaxID=1123043 RepID=A0A8E6B549_9BACT|nr:hypothetical protein [Telmatocola sphagniphila]QVL31479.1 hypothetical protein KIH39_21925 [Telmatocola sphagniphila]